MGKLIGTSMQFGIGELPIVSYDRPVAWSPFSLVFKQAVKACGGNRYCDAFRRDRQRTPSLFESCFRLSRLERNSESHKLLSGGNLRRCDVLKKILQISEKNILSLALRFRNPNQENFRVLQRNSSCTGVEQLCNSGCAGASQHGEVIARYTGHTGVCC